MTNLELYRRLRAASFGEVFEVEDKLHDLMDDIWVAMSDDEKTEAERDVPG